MISLFLGKHGAGVQRRQVCDGIKLLETIRMFYVFSFAIADKKL